MLKKRSFLVLSLVSLFGLTACNNADIPGTSSGGPDASGSASSASAPASKYEVTQEYWTENITRAGYFGVKSNLTMNVTMTSNIGTVQTGLLANANGNLHIQMAADEAVDMYVEPLTDSTYNIYSQEDGKWQMYNLPATYITELSSSFVAFVNPWLYTDFTYNPETHAYEKASDTITVGKQSATLTDIAFKFEDNKLLSLTYTGVEGELTIDFVLTVSNWGSTVVTFPKVDGGDTPVDVTKITLSETEITMKTGENKQIKATVYPEGSDVVVTWTSSAPDVAFVEPIGKDSSITNIKAEKEGVTIVTATVGKVTASCTVTVQQDPDQRIPASSISITQTTLAMKVGESVKFSATVLPANATNKLVHWTVDRKGVVDLAISGDNNVDCTISATGAGTCLLTAAVTAEVQAYCQITVTSGGDQPPVVSPTAIRFSKNSINLKVGDTAVLDATVLPENATFEKLNWSYSKNAMEVTELNEKATSIKIKALAETSSDITAFLSNGAVKAACRVTISPAGTPTVYPTSIVLSPTSLAMKVGETKALSATVLPENATVKTVTWNADAAMVELTPAADNTNNVTVKALAAGTTVISALVGNGLVATCAVTITADGEPSTETNSLVGVTLKYKQFVGPTNYGSEQLSSEDVDAIMGDVRLALFGEPVGEDGEIKGTFEYYHASSPMQGAYLGEYSVYDGNFAMGETSSYYNFQTEKFVFGRGISYRNIVTNYGGFYLTLLDETNAEDYSMGETKLAAGMYVMQGYLMNSDGTVSGKGYAVFEKLNDKPVHLEGIPAEAVEPDFSDVAAGTLFVYNSYIPDDPTFKGNDAYGAEQANATVAFFDDGTFEYHVYNYCSGGITFENEIIYRGTFTVDYSSDEDPVYGDDVYYICCSAADSIQNNIVTPVRFKYFDFYYSVTDNAIYYYRENLAYNEQDGNVSYGNILFKFALSADKPQRYQLPSNDAWDAEAVANALAAAGYSDELPKLDGVKTFEIRDAREDSFVIMNIFTSEDEAALAYANYIGVIGRTFTAVTQYDVTAGDYVLFYFSPNGQYKVQVHNTTNFVQIDVTNAVAVYPGDDIATFLSECTFTDVLPNLAVEGASGYQFAEDKAVIFFYINSDKAEAAQATIVRTLTDAHFFVRKAYGITFYVSPNSQYGLYFIEQAYGLALRFIDAAALPATEYPTAHVASYLEGATDSYPSFAYDGASYLVQEPELDKNYLDLVVTAMMDSPIAEDAYKTTFLPSLAAMLEEKGYTLYKSITLATAEGGTKTYGNIYVSPNSQIGIRIVSGSTGYAQGGDGSQIIVYDSYTISFVNLTKYNIVASDDGKPHLDHITVHGATAYYTIGDEFSFDGVVTAYYTNGGEAVTVDPTTVSTPDMSLEGPQEVIVTYTDAEGITKETSYYINIAQPDHRTYTYKNNNDWDIFDGRAQFKVWAWGGAYGLGHWVDVETDSENKTFIFNLYVNCTGFNIVRLNPAAMPSDDTKWDVTEWNKTSDLVPTVDEELGYVLFTFNG